MKTSRSITLKTSLTVRFHLLLALLFLSPAIAIAANVAVDCGAGETVNGALASLDSVGPHTITVTGTCTENININLRNQITIQAPLGQTATIQAANPNGTVILISSARRIALNRLIVRGARNGIGISLGSDVNIHNSEIAENTNVGILLTQSTLTLDSSTIRDNALTGLQAQAATLCNLGGPATSQHVLITGNGTGVTNLEGFVQLNGNVTVENNVTGFDVAGGRLNLAALQPGVENLIRSNGTAINLRNAATGIFFGKNTVQNSNGHGIIVQNGSNLTINETVLPDATVLTTVIEGHPISGLTVAQQSQASLAGRHKVRNNGASPETCLSTVCGGIRVFSGSQLTLRGGTEVSGNTGPGVDVEHHGTLLIVIPVVIIGNSQEGIRQHIQSATSIVPLTPTPAPEINNISSIVCDNSSVIGGDLKGIGKVKCKEP